MYLGGLHILAIRAGITYVWVRQSDYLSTIGRIGQDLLIARHSRIEYHFTNGLAIGSHGGSAEDSSISKCQNSRRGQQRSSNFLKSDYQIQMHKSGRTWPPARDFADR